MAGGTVITPWQQFALLLIQIGVEDRPIYLHRAAAQLRNWASFRTWCGMGWPFDSTPVLLT